MRFLLIISFFILNISANMFSAEADIRYDSSEVRQLEEPRELLSELRDDGDFQYVEEFVPPPESIWDMISDWLSENILRPVATNMSRDTWRAIIYISFFIILVIVVRLLMKTRFGSYFFGQHKAKKPEVDINEENIHEMDFDKLIKNAVDNNRFNLAVRYLFLKMLKKMSDAEMIAWKIDKTNREYYNEINKPDLRNKFSDIAMHYEYIWYGDFQINGIQYRRIQSDFNNMENMIR